MESHVMTGNPHSAADPASAGHDVGFYGKLPSHGDFLARRVPDAFVGSWDQWLQEGMTATRLRLGAEWLNVYLTSPIWRFVCAAGACGPEMVAGILVPSVDKVGRYFPLTIVTALRTVPNPVFAADALSPFFDAAERLAVNTLELDAVDLAQFDAAVAALGQLAARVYEPTRIVLDRGAARVLTESSAQAWCLPIASPAELSASVLQLAAHRLAEMYSPLVLWWTAGSQLVTPSCLVTRGLPAAEQFVALLHGSWGEHLWAVVPAHVEFAAPAAGDTALGDPRPPVYRAAAATHIGAVRRVNQDAYLERTDVGLWVVADGVGGQQDGEVASRMVCDALGGFAPHASFEDMIDGTRERLHAVNDQLVRAATRPEHPVTSGSTVVALMARGTRCAVLWAGDSRVYRLRDGRMEQLTRDHSLAELEPAHEDSHAITRAIGGDATLALDLFRDRVRPGDRFLLCSDGLSRVLWESDMAEWLAADDISVAAQGLVQETLDGGAPDNVTVLVVEAYADDAPVLSGPVAR
jgi:type VI secretion system protein ImpM